MPTPAQIIRRRARRYGLDPRAVLSVARGEGGLVNRAGDIGDLAGGGSYGPFQLYAQGALPAHLRGRPQAADSWAWSRQGIDYALRQMVKVGASGLRGPAAIEKIIREFERPADPDSSVSAAIARYQEGGAMSPPPGGRRTRTRAGSGGYVTNKPEVMALRQQAKMDFVAALNAQSRARGSGQPSDHTSVTRALQALRAAENTPIVRKRRQRVQGLRGAQNAAQTVSGGRAIKGGVVIGTPNSGTHTLGNWQSDNAIDVRVPEGTPIYAVADGVIDPSRYGSLNSSNPRMAGLRMTLHGRKNSWYYAHLSKLVVKPGARVKKGQLIGYSGSANGTPHLHFATERGDPRRWYE